MSIGSNIRRLRESHQLTQKQLGDILGITDKAVSTWENDIKTPRTGMLKALADYFGITTDQLLGEKPPRDEVFVHTLDRLCAAWEKTPQDLEQALALPHGRLAQLRESGLPTEEERRRIEAYFGVPSLRPAEPTEGSNVVPYLARTDVSRRIPVLGRVPAGVPVEAVTDVIDHLELSPPMATDGYDYFALMVTGDSMFPEYRAGDIGIVRVQPTAETGDDVVAYIGGSDATLKRFTRTADGIQLRPLNQAYAVRSFTKEQVLSLPVTLAGIVVEQRRIRRR